MKKEIKFASYYLGIADLIRYDFNGNKTIIGHFTCGDIFGESLYPANTNNELFVEAKENSEVLIFNYDLVKVGCKKMCEFHNEFQENLTSLIISNTIKLNNRIELLSKKNIRDKLISYFNMLSNQKFYKTFDLPFSYTDLADYLSIDRSAMMREISHLQKEGIIKKSGRTITLLIS